MSNNEFKSIYPVEIKKHPNLGRDKKKKLIEEEQYRKLGEYLNRPSNIGYYENLMRSESNLTGKRLVGYFCNIVPQELIRAFGVVPVRLDCGNNALVQTGEEVFSGEICPLTKSSMGSILSDNAIFEACDLIIIPASCDSKKKIAEIIADMKKVFVLNIPAEQNHEKYSEYGYKEMQRLCDFLEEFYKTRLDKKKLKQEIELSNKRTTLIRKLQEIRIQNPRALNAADYHLIIQAGLIRPVNLDSYVEELSITLKEVCMMPVDTKNLRYRLVLTGAPMIWPNFKLLHVLQECGADIIADTLCSGEQSCFDPVIADETSKKSLLNAVSNRAFFAVICPCFTSQTTRINRVLDIFKTSRAQGVVNYSLRLCQLFDMENFRLERVMKSKSISFLNIRSDYSLEDTEQLRVRAEAYLETI